MFSCEFCEIYKNIFFHRTPLVAGSAITNKTGQLKAEIKASFCKNVIVVNVFEIGNEIRCILSIAF